MQQVRDLQNEYKDNKLPEQVEGIKAAVNSVLKYEAWKNFHYSLSYEELAMYHDDLGILPVSLLSDGVRAMVSLTADLAWQQRVINSLQTIFKNIQFIVTTHSPQVLSTVSAENIRLLKYDTDMVAMKPSTQSRGVTSAGLIQQNLYETEQAKELRQKLNKHFGEQHQEKV